MFHQVIHHLAEEKRNEAGWPESDAGMREKLKHISTTWPSASSSAWVISPFPLRDGDGTLFQPFLYIETWFWPDRADSGVTRKKEEEMTSAFHAGWRDPNCTSRITSCLLTWTLRGSSIKTKRRNGLNQLQLTLLAPAQVVNIWWLFFFDQFT